MPLRVAIAVALLPFDLAGYLAREVTEIGAPRNAWHRWFAWYPVSAYKDRVTRHWVWARSVERYVGEDNTMYLDGITEEDMRVT